MTGPPGKEPIKNVWKGEANLGRSQSHYFTAGWASCSLSHCCAVTHWALQRLTKFSPKPVMFRDNPLVPFFAFYLMLNLKLCALSARLQSLQHPRCENRYLQSLPLSPQTMPTGSATLRPADWTFSKWIRENSVSKAQLSSCIARLVMNIKIESLLKRLISFLFKGSRQSLRQGRSVRYGIVLAGSRKKNKQKHKSTFRCCIFITISKGRPVQSGSDSGKSFNVASRWLDWKRNRLEESTETVLTRDRNWDL